MIYDHISHQQLYRGVAPGLQLAFDYLLNFDEATPDGRYELDGENVIAMPQSYETRPFAEKRLESHMRYLDVQYILSGAEVMYHAPIERLVESVPYNDAKDVVFYANPAVNGAGQDQTSQALYLQAGDFCVFYPHDGHKPGCSLDPAAPASVRKIVVKVRV